ncbi:MAG: amidohydrolase family protein, partial [Nitrososphaeraceae archaeon]
ALANHRKPDLIIKNANIVNVLSGEIYNANVAIADGIFVGIWDVEGGVDIENINAESVFDAQGRFMSPGLIDGHIHIESTFLSPTEFCNIVAPHGTSAVICDPPEITNVLGTHGIDYILQSTGKSLSYDAFLCSSDKYGNIGSYYSCRRHRLLLASVP